VFGAPHAERALAFRAGFGQPGLSFGRRNETPVVLSSRLVQRLITPCASHACDSGILEVSGPQLANTAQTDSPLEVGDCRQRLAYVFVDGSCLVRYKRAESEARTRSRRLAERKLQARELGGFLNSRDNKSTAEIGERHLLRVCKAG
jgi:hypothetical protein